MSDTGQAQGMSFPCDFEVKAMGLSEPGFDALVVEIVQRHGPKVHEGAVSLRPSKNGRYLSVSVRFTAQSMDQLNAIWGPDSKIDNWSQIPKGGFSDVPLALAGPDSQSGTYDFFNEEVLGEDAQGETITPRQDCLHIPLDLGAQHQD